MKTTARIRAALEALLPRYEAGDLKLKGAHFDAPYICVNLREQLGHDSMGIAERKEPGYCEARKYFESALALDGRGFGVRAEAIRNFLEETAE